METILIKNLFLDDHKEQLNFWVHLKNLKKEHSEGNSVEILDHCAKLKHNLGAHFDSE